MLSKTFTADVMSMKLSAIHTEKLLVNNEKGRCSILFPFLSLNIEIERNINISLMTEWKRVSGKCHVQ